MLFRSPRFDSTVALDWLCGNIRKPMSWRRTVHHHTGVCTCIILYLVFKIQGRVLEVPLHLSPILLRFCTLFLSLWEKFLYFFHSSVDALGNILMADLFFFSNLIHGHFINKVHPYSAELLFRKSSSNL